MHSGRALPPVAQGWPTGVGKPHVACLAMPCVEHPPANHMFALAPGVRGWWVGASDGSGRARLRTHNVLMAKCAGREVALAIPILLLLASPIVAGRRDADRQARHLGPPSVWVECGLRRSHLSRGAAQPALCDFHAGPIQDRVAFRWLLKLSAQSRRFMHMPEVYVDVFGSFRWLQPGPEHRSQALFRAFLPSGGTVRWTNGGYFNSGLVQRSAAPDRVASRRQTP